MFMKKYKVLLMGKNNTIKDDFFTQMADAFSVVSTSMRKNDFMNHLDFFMPDILVYCLSDDKHEDWSRMIEFKIIIEQNDILTVVVGSEDSCDSFQRTTNELAKLVIQQPITATAIKQKISDYMEDVEKEREEERLRLLALAEEEERKRRKHILVIDDDPMMLKLIKEHLHEKYDVATAISGKIAHKFLESKKTDLILLDYEMPVENGPEVLMKIRENEELAKIPVIFLTGISETDKIKQALILKPQGYLLKPIDRTKLFETIEQFIG